MGNILITGANGFIGRAVTKALRDAGHTLSGTTRDRSLRAGPENIPLYHIPNIGTNTDWSQVLSGADSVVHLAARVHVMKDTIKDRFDEYNSVNYEGTKLLAESAVAAGVRRLVFVSTIKVNGEMTKRKPFSQSDSPSPLGPYSISKWEAEKALFEIHNTKNLELVILRAPLVYGPHVKGNFWALLEACAQQKLLPFKAITNLRSFLYVGNLASAITICLGHPCANGKTYLLSDGEDMSTPELIRRISKAMGVDSRLFSLPFWLLALICRLVGRKEAIERLTNSLQIDTTLIKEELGWHPPYSVNDGLQRTAHWFLEDEVKR